MFTDEESKIIKDNLKRRVDMIDGIFEEGVPIDNRDKRMALELISSTDDSIIRLGKLRQDDTKNKDDNAVKTAVLQALKESRGNRERRVIDVTIPDFEEEEIGEILLTELSFEPTKLSPADFLEEDDV